MTSHIDEVDEEEQTRTDRRTFLKGCCLAVGAATVGTSGTRPVLADEDLPSSEHIQTVELDDTPSGFGEFELVDYDPDSDDYVIAGADDDRVAKIHAETGEEDWIHEMGTDENLWGLETDATDSYVSVRGQDYNRILDFGTGGELWTPEEVSYHTFDPDGEYIYIGHGSGVEKRDAETGDLVWEFDDPPYDTDGVNRMGLDNGGDTFYINADPTGDEVITALDAETGEVIWENDGDEVDDGVREFTPFPSDDALSVLIGFEYVRMDAGTGEVEWRYSEIINTPRGSAVPPSEGYVYATDGDTSDVHALDSSTGDVEWIFDGNTDDSYNVESIETDSNGDVYTATEDSIVRRLDGETGDLVWAYDGHESDLEHMDLNPSEEHVFSASEDTTVHQIDAETGESVHGEGEPLYSFDFAVEGLAAHTVEPVVERPWRAVYDDSEVAEDESDTFAVEFDDSGEYEIELEVFEDGELEIEDALTITVESEDDEDDDDTGDGGFSVFGFEFEALDGFWVFGSDDGDDDDEEEDDSWFWPF